jgi:peptide/nickel transport system substrate-binding protein
MRFRSRGWWTVIVTVVLLLGGLVAQAAAPAEAPRRTGAVLSVVQYPRQAPFTRTFSPFRSQAEGRWPTWAGIHEPLIICNRHTGVFTPWLATAHAWSPDNLKLRFTLRPGVLWADGRPFTARDVVFTFELMRRVPALDHDHVWEFLSSVAAPDARTAEFTLKRPYTPGLLYIGEHPIVAEHHWKDVADPEAFEDPSPVGTGPFVNVLKFEPAAYELARNPSYWQAGKPAFDVLRVLLLKSNDDLARALLADEVDWASLFFRDVEREWVASDPARHQYWYADTGPTVLLYANTRQNPFDSTAVRKAVSMALDRARISKEAMRGYAPPADPTGLAESQKKWKQAALVQEVWTRRDVAAANRMLDEAGLARGADGVRVTAGAPLRYTLRTVQGWTDWAMVADIVRENLAEVGIAVTVRALDYPAWDEALRHGRFDLSLGFASRGPTPYEFYRGQMDSTLVRKVGDQADSNFHRFGDAEATRLLRQIEQTSAEAETVALMADLQKRYVLTTPSIPLFVGPQWGVYNSTRFTGFPSRFRPYGNSAPIGLSRGAVPSPDSLPVLLEVQPR